MDDFFKFSGHFDNIYYNGGGRLIQKQKPRDNAMRINEIKMNESKSLLIPTVQNDIHISSDKF